MPTPFEILQVIPTASSAEIQNVYQTLISTLDLNDSQDAEKIKEVQRAYKEIIDSENPVMLAASSPAFAASANDSSLLKQENNSLSLKELTEKNKIFAKYIYDIFEQINHHTSSPQVILSHLLKSYVAGGITFFSILNSRSYLVLAKDLQDLLNNESEFALSTVFSKLETSEVTFKPFGEFIELWKAFFAFYPLYLMQLKSCKLKDQLSAIPKNSALCSPIFKAQSNNLLISMDACSVELFQSDIQLIVTTNSLEAFITLTFKQLPANPSSAIPRKNLARLAEHMNTTELKDKALPIFLEMLSNGQKHNMDEGALHLFHILIKRLPPELVIEHILAPIIRFQEQDPFFSTYLADIAECVGKKTTNDVIFPKLLELLDSDRGAGDVIAYQSINRILHLIKHQYILDKLLPKMCEESELSYYTEPERLKIFSHLVTIKQACICESDMAILIKTINILRSTILSGYRETLGLYHSDQPSQIHDYFTTLSPNEFKKNILSQALAFISQPGNKVDKSHYETVTKLCSIPPYKVPTDFKRQVFLTLMEQMQYELNIPLIQAITSFMPWGNDDQQLMGKLLGELLEKVNLTTSFKSYSLEYAILELIRSVINYVDPGLLEQLVMPKLLSYDMQTLPFQAIEILSAAARCVPNDYLKGTLIPQIFLQLQGSCEKPAQIFTSVAHQLSYEDTVYYMAQIMNSFEKSEASKKPKTDILLALYGHQQKLINEQQTLVKSEVTEEETQWEICTELTQC